MESLKEKSRIIISSIHPETVDPSGRSSSMRAKEMIRSGYLSELQKPTSQEQRLNGTPKTTESTDTASTTE